MNGKNLSAAGPNYLPPFEKNYQGYIRCHCVPAVTLAEDIAAHNILLECQEATPTANVMDAKDLSETPHAESPPLPAVVHGSHVLQVAFHECGKVELRAGFQTSRL